MFKDKSVRFKDPGLPKAKTLEKQIKNLVSKLKKLGVDINYHSTGKVVAEYEYEIKN